MFCALDTTTGQEVDADELPEMKSVNPLNYRCVGCTISLFPSSFADDNLISPHFKKSRGAEHDSDCTIMSEEKIRKLADKKSIFTQYNYPFPHPAKLKLQDDTRPDNTNTNVNERFVVEFREEAQVEKSLRKRGPKVVNTLSQIARLFYQCPNDHHLELSLPGFPQERNTYESCFQKIRSDNKGVRRYTGPFIFFGSLFLDRNAETKKFEAVFSRTSETLSVDLKHGLWKEIDGKLLLEKRVTLKFNLATWTQLNISTCRKKLLGVSQIAAQDWKVLTPAIFFLGTQDPVDPYTFHCSDRRLFHSEAISKKMFDNF